MAKAQGVSQLTQERLRRGVFHSVPELVAAIEAYLQHHNENPTPFVWTATADAILEKIGKCTVIPGRPGVSRTCRACGISARLHHSNDRVRSAIAPR